MCLEENNTARFPFIKKIARFTDLVTKIYFILFFSEAQLYRIRQEHLPPSPTDSNFVLHPSFTSTDKGERFLLYDSNNVQLPYPSSCSKVERLLIFSSDLQLMLLSKSKRVGSDGTFETSPAISNQIYILIGEYEETTSGKNKL